MYEPDYRGWWQVHPDCPADTVNGRDSSRVRKQLSAVPAGRAAAARSEPSQDKRDVPGQSQKRLPRADVPHSSLTVSQNYAAGLTGGTVAGNCPTFADSLNGGAAVPAWSALQAVNIQGRTAVQVGNGSGRQAAIG